MRKIWLYIVTLIFSPRSSKITVHKPWFWDHGLIHCALVYAVFPLVLEIMLREMSGLGKKG